MSDRSAVSRSCGSGRLGHTDGALFPKACWHLYENEKRVRADKRAAFVRTSLDKLWTDDSEEREKRLDQVVSAVGAPGVEPPLQNGGFLSVGWHQRGPFYFLALNSRPACSERIECKGGGVTGGASSPPPGEARCRNRYRLARRRTAS